MADSSLREGTALQLWYELVRDGEARCHLQLPELVESYLVFTLQRHQRDALLAGRTMALELLEGSEHLGALRSERLRDVGDRCLLIAGLFPDLARRRNVAPRYYVALGSGAYHGAAGATRAGESALYAQLAGAFGAMCRVLGGGARRGRGDLAGMPAAT